MSSPQGGNTVFSSTGSVTRTNADGTTTQTVGNSETTWLSGGMQRTLFKTEGLTLTSDADGAYSFSTDSGHQIFLGSDGLVQDEFQGTRRTLESVAVDLKGGGHLAVRGGMATVLLQDGNSLDVYSGGTRRETIGAVSTTYSPDGSMVQTEGAKTVWFNATDMSVTTAVAEKVVNRVDYDGVVTNFKYEYGQVHTEQKLTSGYTVIDGLCPQIQLRRIDGTVGPASVSVYRTPWGQADTEENKRMVALQAAGNGVVGMVNGHPLAGKVGVISSVGMHSSAVQVMTVKTADGQEMEVGNLLLLSATDKQDGRRQLRFYRYEPGLFQGDLKTSIDIVGRADKAELSKDPKYNDPVFSLNVTLVGGQQTTVKAAEFSPFEMTWTGTPAAGRAQFKQVPAIIATTPPEETSAAPPPTPPPLKPLDAIAGMKWEPSANSVRDAQEGNVLGILSYTIGMGGKVIHKLIESTVGWLADHLPAGFQQVAQFATGLLEGLSDSLIGMIGTTVDLVNFASQMTRLFVFSTPEQFVSDPYVCGVMKGVQDAVKRILEFTKAYNASPVLRARTGRYVKDFLSEHATDIYLLGQSAIVGGPNGLALAGGSLLLTWIARSLFQEASAQVTGDVLGRLGLSSVDQDPSAAMAVNVQLAGSLVGSLIGMMLTLPSKTEQVAASEVGTVLENVRAAQVANSAVPIQEMLRASMNPYPQIRLVVAGQEALAVSEGMSSLVGLGRFGMKGAAEATTTILEVIRAAGIPDSAAISVAGKVAQKLAQMSPDLALVRLAARVEVELGAELAQRVFNALGPTAFGTLCALVGQASAGGQKILLQIMRMASESEVVLGYVARRLTSLSIGASEGLLSALEILPKTQLSAGSTPLTVLYNLLEKVPLSAKANRIFESFGICKGLDNCGRLLNVIATGNPPASAAGFCFHGEVNRYIVKYGHLLGLEAMRTEIPAGLFPMQVDTLCRSLVSRGKIVLVECKNRVPIDEIKQMALYVEEAYNNSEVVAKIVYFIPKGSVIPDKLFSDLIRELATKNIAITRSELSRLLEFNRDVPKFIL